MLFVTINASAKESETDVASPSHPASPPSRPGIWLAKSKTTEWERSQVKIFCDVEIESQIQSVPN